MRDDMHGGVSQQAGHVVVDMASLRELLHQCDRLVRLVPEETKKQRMARKVRLRETKEEIKVILPLYKVVWFAHYQRHGLIPL